MRGTSVLTKQLLAFAQGIRDLGSLQEDLLRVLGGKLTSSQILLLTTSSQKKDSQESILQQVSVDDLVGLSLSYPEDEAILVQIL